MTLSSVDRSPSTTFRIITGDEVWSMCRELLVQILPFRHEFSCIYGIPRGGLPIAVYLSNHLNLAMVDLERAETYPKKILLVEDLTDTGLVIANTIKLLPNSKVAVLFKKPWSNVQPDFCVATTEDFIVYPWEPIPAKFI